MYGVWFLLLCVFPFYARVKYPIIELDMSRVWYMENKIRRDFENQYLTEKWIRTNCKKQQIFDYWYVNHFFFAIFNISSLELLKNVLLHNIKANDLYRIQLWIIDLLPKSKLTQ